MRNLAPDIFRQRFLVEGYYAGEMTKERLTAFLNDLAAHLSLRTYADPIVFTPATGMGREDNEGFDAFVPLIDSGISAYVWSRSRFFSVLLYTCKGFDEVAAERFVRESLGVDGETATQSF